MLDLKGSDRAQLAPGRRFVMPTAGGYSVVLGVFVIWTKGVWP